MRRAQVGGGCAQAVVVAATLGLAACSATSPGHRSLCDLAPVDAAPPAPADDAAAANPSGPETGAAEAGGGGGVSTAAFEKSCATAADCAAPAPYCAVPPGKCTATGCDVDPTVCPTGWPCMDLTPYGMALHLCVPPGTPGT